MIIFFNYNDVSTNTFTWPHRILDDEHKCVPNIYRILIKGCPYPQMGPVYKYKSRR